MAAHKFRIGQKVQLVTPLFEPAGDYEIVRQLPDANGECHHRIKSADEPHERAVKESQLRKSFDG
jgi:hypothetical protein